MTIDHKNGVNDFTDKCPACGEELEFINLPRYSVEDICPKCKQQLEIEYDFILLDDYDEWDIYSLKIKSP